MYTFTYSNKQKDEFEEVNGCFEQNPKRDNMSAGSGNNGIDAAYQCFCGRI